MLSDSEDSTRQQSPVKSYSKIVAETIVGKLSKLCLKDHITFYYILLQYLLIINSI